MKNILTFLFILISLSVVAQDWDTDKINGIEEAIEKAKGMK